METTELFALSLAASVLAAGAAYGLVTLFERGTLDPVLRERAWAMAFYISALPISLVTLSLLLPPTTVTRAVGLAWTGPTAAALEVVVHQAVPVNAADDRIALSVLSLAGLLAFVRLTGLARRTVRLRRLIRASGPVSPAVRQCVEAVVHRLDAPMPEVRVSGKATGALVAGLRRPVLLLPERLITAADAQALSAVCAHELAHLRRGDHRALWIEEVLLAMMAFNPILSLIRDHRAAAREEACDVAALAQAGPEDRRRYARALLDAFRASPTGQDVPALTVTSSRRIRVMTRFQAILSPVPRSGIRQKLTVLGLGIAVTAVTGSGSLALAAQREALTPPPPAVVAVNPVRRPKTTAAEVLAVPAATSVAVAKTDPEAKPEFAQRQAVEPAEILNPAWDRPPMPSYPAAALEQGLSSGAADLSCAVGAGGRVAGCQVVSETPAGAGFGRAALQAAAIARLSPQTIAGAADAGIVRFTVRFKMSPS